MHRIFLVDDHQVIRRGLAHLLGQATDFVVCGEASSAEEALEKVLDAAPDLLVTDLTLTGMDGLALIKHLLSLRPDLPVLVFTMHDEALYAERALRAGARGFLRKTAPDHTLLEAVRLILRGGVYMSPEVQRLMMQRLVWSETGAGAASASPVDRLTDRELEVFYQCGHGMTRAQIAEALNISPKTVDSHYERIKEKLGLETIGQLTREAVRWVEQQEGGER